MMNTKIMQLIFFAGFLFLAINCTGIYEDGKELASDAESKIAQISVDALKAKIEKQEEEFFLIDVRQSSDYKKGNIEGSYSITSGVVEFKIANTEFWDEEFIDPPADTSQLILYSSDGAGGALAVESLIKLKYKNVKNLEGGYAAFNPNPQATEAPESEGGCGG